jgi:uncharacterized protein Smg (DUF494 family)
VKPVPVKVIEINVPDYVNKTNKESPKTFTNNLLKKGFEENVQNAVSKMEQEKREMEEARKKALQLEEKLFEKAVKESRPNVVNQNVQAQPSNTNAGNKPVSSNVLPHLYGVDPELVDIMRDVFVKYAQKKETEFQESLKRLEGVLKRVGLDQENIQKSIEGFKRAVENTVKNIEKDSKHVPRYAPPDFTVDPRLVFVYMPEPIRKIIDDYVSGKLRTTDKYPREE